MRSGLQHVTFMTGIIKKKKRHTVFEENMWSKSAVHMYSIFVLQTLQAELGFSQGTSNTFVDVFLGKCTAVGLLTLDSLQSAATPATI